MRLVFAAINILNCIWHLVGLGWLGWNLILSPGLVTFEDDKNTTVCDKEMTECLESVLEERDSSDLRDTRRQIHSFVDTVFCYMTTHPGFKVTKKNHSRIISQVDGTVLKLSSISIVILHFPKL